MASRRPPPVPLASHDIYDCLVIGGGPAGLSAALMLGRCRRRVLICDAGAPRNAASRAMHGFLTRDGIAPQEFLTLARAELQQYDTVSRYETKVVRAAGVPTGFAIECQDGHRFQGRTLLLATGVVDELPAIDGLQELYGTSVHHCPHCDAWEWRDHPIAVYGHRSSAVNLAMALTQWSKDIALCTDGRVKISGQSRKRLRACGVTIYDAPLARLEGRNGKLERIKFTNGQSLSRAALFFASGPHQRSILAEQLGCRFTAKGAIATGPQASTNIPRLFIAGDASKDAQLVVVAAAEGTQAAVAINGALLKDDIAETIPL